MAPSNYARRPLLNSEAASQFHHHARHIMARTNQPRDNGSSPDQKTTILLVVLGLVALVTLSISGFLLFRRYQRKQQQMRDNSLTSYQEAKLGMYESTTNLNGLTIETKHHGRSSMITIRRDSHPMLANPESPPNSPDNVPEIHITVPDETDEKGNFKGPRVLVVRVGDNASVGLEPMNEEQLPPYQKEEKSGFYSVDMDRIGGLKEKDRTQFQ